MSATRRLTGILAGMVAFALPAFATQPTGSPYEQGLAATLLEVMNGRVVCGSDLAKVTADLVAAQAKIRELEAKLATTPPQSPPPIPPKP